MKMKRIILIISVLAACVSAAAQNPKAVIKAIIAGEDKASVAQKYQKAVEKHDVGEPAMILANDMILHSEGQSVFAYTNYCAHREEIEGDETVQKILKSLKLTLADIFNQMESVSAIKVMDEDKESAYDKYIHVAERNGHPMLQHLVSAREVRAFGDVCAANTLQEYDRFIAKYPDAAQARMSEVVARRTDVVFDTVMVSSSEAASEDFIANYPEYGRKAEVEAHLSDLRFERVTSVPSIDDLKWFVGLYPGYPRVGEAVTLLSKLEYDVLDRADLKAVAAYVSAYPDAEHSPELSAMLAHERMIETADLAAIFAYVREHGYDDQYSRMVRAVARIHSKAIVTPDIREVDLVRFVDASGKVGYWNMAGEVAVEPIFDQFTPKGDYPFDVVYGVEFLRGRNAAAVSNAQMCGAVGPDGQMVVPLNGLGIAMEDNIILLVKQNRGGSFPEYATEVYNFAGAPVTMGTWAAAPEAPACARRGIFDNGVTFEFRNGSLNANVNVCLEPTGFFKYIVKHDGSTLNQKAGSFQAYTDDYIVTERGLTDVNTWIVAGPDPYEEHHFIRDGRILVRNGARWGYLDQTLAEVIPLQYDSASDFCGPTALVNGRTLIDAAGAVVFEADSIAELATALPSQAWSHYVLYSFVKDGVRGVVDSTGAVLLTGVDASAMSLVEMLSSVR